MKNLLVLVLLCLAGALSAAEFHLYTNVQTFIEIDQTRYTNTLITRTESGFVVGGTNCLVIGNVGITNKSNVLVIKPDNAPAREIQLTEAEMDTLKKAIRNNW